MAQPTQLLSPRCSTAAISNADAVQSARITFRSSNLLLFLLVLVCSTFPAFAGSYEISVGDGTLSWQATQISQESCPIGSPGGTQEPVMQWNFSSFSYTSAGVTQSLSGSAVYLDSPGGPYCPASGAQPVTLPLGGNNFVIDFQPQDGGNGTANITWTGYINPKYIVVGVTYAPPGPSSFVQYTTNSFLSNTTSSSETFAHGTTVTVSVSNGASLFGFAAGKLTATTSTTWTQSSTNSSSITISRSSQFSNKTPGTPQAYSPVNHDYDIIWLWLNPVAIYSINSDSPNSVTWSGYGFDMADQPDLDIWPVYVGYLNGDFGPLDSQDASVLARSWANGKQSWPSGQGPGITSADFPTILSADPFGNPSQPYTFTLASGVSPATTTDGRFTLSGGVNGTNQSFVYKQPPPGESPITQTYSNTYSNASTLGQSSTSTTQTTFGIDVNFDGTDWISKFKLDIKNQYQFTWTNTASTSTTNTTGAVNNLSITGPPCNATTAPCVPQYTTPAEFDVYQDNLYGNFMFNPVN